MRARRTDSRRYSERFTVRLHLHYLVPIAQWRQIEHAVLVFHLPEIVPRTQIIPGFQLDYLHSYDPLVGGRTKKEFHFQIILCVAG
jgi:hypothetical protein